LCSILVERIHQPLAEGNSVLLETELRANVVQGKGLLFDTRIEIRYNNERDNAAFDSPHWGWDPVAQNHLEFRFVNGKLERVVRSQVYLVAVQRGEKQPRIFLTIVIRDGPHQQRPIPPLTWSDLGSNIA
jgi:hypothetical protein